MRSVERPKRNANNFVLGGYDFSIYESKHKSNLFFKSTSIGLLALEQTSPPQIIEIICGIAGVRDDAA
jgi:hypothetical protein